jgi:chromosome segregation ATPase
MKRFFAFLLVGILSAVIIGTVATTYDLNINTVEASSSYRVVTEGNTVVNVITPENFPAIEFQNFIGQDVETVSTIIANKGSYRVEVIKIGQTQISNNYGQMTTEEKIEHITELITQYVEELDAINQSVLDFENIDISNYTEAELAEYEEALTTLLIETEEIIAKLADLDNKLLGIESQMVREQMRLTYNIQLKVPETAEGELHYEKQFRYYEKRSGITQGQMYSFTYKIAHYEENLLELEAQLELKSAELIVLTELDISAYTEEELIIHNEQVALIEAEIVALNEDIVNCNEHIIEKGDAVLQMQRQVTEAQAQVKRQQMEYNKQQKDLNAAKTKVKAQQQKAIQAKNSAQEAKGKVNQMKEQTNANSSNSLRRTSKVLDNRFSKFHTFS